MRYPFNVKLSGSGLTKPYDFIHNLVSDFIAKVKGYINLYDYQLINKIDGGGNAVLSGDGMNSWTTSDEAAKLKMYCYDFWVYKDGVLSRAYRITGKLALNGGLMLGVCNYIPDKKPDSKFRGVDLCKDGRTVLFGDYVEQTKPSGKTLSRNNKKPNWNDPNNVFNCWVAVNEDIILVHGKLQSDSNLTYLPGNYLSYIKCYNLYNIHRSVILCNGIYGYYNTKVDVAPSITQKPPTDGSISKARLGIQLKIRMDRNTTFEYGSHRIMIIPKIRDFIASQHLTNEPYKVYFENLYREDDSFFGLVDSISGITTNMCLIIA